MPSILGLGIWETGKIMKIWETSRSEVIPRVVVYSVMPIIQELVKERLGKMGIIEKLK